MFAGWQGGTQPPRCHDAGHGARHDERAQRRRAGRPMLCECCDEYPLGSRRLFAAIAARCSPDSARADRNASASARAPSQNAGLGPCPARATHLLQARRKFRRQRGWVFVRYLIQNRGDGCPAKRSATGEHLVHKRAQRPAVRGGRGRIARVPVRAPYRRANPEGRPFG
jgi:hypothetical protein